MNKKFLHIIIFLISVGTLSAGSTFSGKRLEDAVVNYIRSNTKHESKILLLNDIKDYKFNQSQITASINHSEELRGYTHINLIFRDDNQIVKEIKVAVRIRLFSDVLTYAYPMKIGQEITSGNIKYASKEITDYSEGELPSKESIAGKLLNKSVTSGRIVTLNDIAEEKVINRGDKIPIVVTAGAVQIRTLGTALNSAKAGEEIRVKRDGTQNRILYGTAAKDGSVLISSNDGGVR